MIQEQVSRRDAVTLGSTLYSSVISLAIGAAMTMATVLFAVATSMKAVRNAIPNMPPRRLSALLRMKERMAAKPPLARIRAAIEATRIVTIIVSNIPEIPPPMEERALA